MISVIMCTWNNCERLGITLNAFSRCDPPPCEWELVLVANNCSDDTESVAKSFGASLPLRYVVEERQGLSRARNAGIRAASGDLIIFTDDDVKPAAGWLGTYWQAFRRHPEGVYFGGPVVSEFEGPEPDAELLRFAPWSIKGLDLGPEERTLDDQEMFLSANWALPKEGLRSGGGFDESRGLGAHEGRVSVGEELELQLRLREMGWRGLVLPEATIQHFVPADKTTLQHIADRCEANGYQAGLTWGDGTNPNAVPYPTLFGIPRWRIRAACERWFAYQCSRLLQRDSARPYLEYRTHRGALRAHRDLQRGERPS